jgi:hypothetical protein
MGVLYILSIYFFSLKNNIRNAVIFLFIGGIAGRLLIINFDQFLHPWDEQLPY